MSFAGIPEENETSYRSHMDMFDSQRTQAPQEQTIPRPPECGGRLQKRPEQGGIQCSQGIPASAPGP